MKKRIFILAILLLTFASITFGNYFPDVIIMGSEGTWMDTRVYADIDDAVAAALATGEHRDMYIVRQEATTALTLHPALTVKFFASGSIANSGQLTINTTNIIASNRQIFTGAGDIDWIAGSVAKTSWFVDLDWALEVTNDDTMTLEVTRAETTDANMAVGDNVTLKWNSPFIITIDTGDTLSNVKNIEAGNYQIFAGAGDLDLLDGTRFKLDWVIRLRQILNWIEAEQVTIVVSGDNEVTFTDTATANEYFDFQSENGWFSIDSGVTLTINSPSHIIAASRQIIQDNVTTGGELAFTNGGEVSIHWWGWSTSASEATNVAAFADAIKANRTINIESGTYSVTPLTLVDMSSVTIKGHGIVRLQASEGEAVLTLGDAAHLAPIRRLHIENIVFTGSGTLTYGVKLLYVTDSNFTDIRILDITNIATGMYINWSWNNNFYNTEIQAKNAIFFGLDNPNNNNFYGGRFRGSDNTADFGIQARGYNNSFTGMDVSNFKYGILIPFVRAFSFINGYFEANGTNDIVFNQVGGNSKGVIIQGNHFAGGTTAIETIAGGTAHYNVVIKGNHFRVYTTCIILDDLISIGWEISANYMEDCTTKVSGVGLRTLILDNWDEVLSISKITTNVNRVRSYRINKGVANGTVIIDSLANINDTLPSAVRVIGVGRGGAIETEAFEIYIIFEDDGAIDSSGEIYDTAGITAIQVNAGNLEVTTLDNSNWNFWIIANIWAD